MSVMIAVLLALSQAPAASPTPAPPPSRPEIAAEVERGIKAYNAQDLAYYKGALAPDVVYIADDGAVFTGKERVIELFTRIFARPQKAHLEVAGVVTGGKGDAAWARFAWTLSGIDRARPGVATVIFQPAETGWQVASIQNTGKGGHMMRAASPAPGASPSPDHQH